MPLQLLRRLPLLMLSVAAQAQDCAEPQEPVTNQFRLGALFPMFVGHVVGQDRDTLVAGKLDTGGNQVRFPTGVCCLKCFSTVFNAVFVLKLLNLSASPRLPHGCARG